jgi:diadenosine tetraphosphatase ApaH/serine/threonine PP2A family protein phosphatase
MLPQTNHITSEIFLFHSTPTNRPEYLLETVGHSRSRLATPEEIQGRLGAQKESVLICGHSHIPRVVQLPGDKLIINPGSVGLPLNQRTTAQFALLETVDDAVELGGWRARHHEVAYDRRPVLEAFATSGMLAAGGVISTLFYWEVVTAEPEIIYFYRWAYAQGLDPDRNGFQSVFQRYLRESGRAEVIRQADPLHADFVG